MTEEFKQWEYRVQTIGSMLGTKDENLEETLDTWGEEGWEAINVFTPYGRGKITIGAKRLLTERTRRMRNRLQTRLS
jgi:hypothetical protein